MSILKKQAEMVQHSGAVYALAKGNFAHTFFSAGADKVVAEWNLDTFTPEKFSVRTDAPVYSLCPITEMGLLLIGLSNGSLHIIDLKEKKEIRHIKHHTGAVYDIKYSATQNLIFTCDGNGNLSVWKANDFSLLLNLPLCEEKIRQVAVHPAGNELAVACGDHHTRIIDTSYFNEKYRLSGHTMGVNSVCYIHGGSILITGGKDACLNFYDVTNGYVQLKKIPAHNFAIYSIEEDQLQPLFFTCSRDKTIKAWDSTTFEILQRIDRRKHGGHLHSVNRLLVTGYKNKIVSAGDDRAVMVWGLGEETS